MRFHLNTLVKFLIVDPMIKNKKVFFILTGIIFLLVIEVVSRLIIANLPSYQLRKWNNEALWRHAWIRHKKSSNFTYTHDDYHPKLAWIPKANAKTRYVTINSQTLRADRDYDLNKKEGITRIAVIGDSHSFGDEVRDKETFSYHLEKMTNAL